MQGQHGKKQQHHDGQAIPLLNRPPCNRGLSKQLAYASGCGLEHIEVDVIVPVFPQVEPASDDNVLETQDRMRKLCDVISQVAI